MGIRYGFKLSHIGWLVFFLSTILIIESKKRLTNEDSIRLLELTKPGLHKLTSRLANKAVDFQSKLRKSKRSLEKRSLKEKFQNYIAKKYTEPMIKSFQPKMDATLSQGIQHFEQRLAKRDLTQEEYKQMAKQYTVVLSKKVEEQLRDHSKSRLTRWLDNLKSRVSKEKRSLVIAKR
jgi:hypothetical protein